MHLDRRGFVLSVLATAAFGGPAVAQQAQVRYNFTGTNFGPEAPRRAPEPQPPSRQRTARTAPRSGYTGKQTIAYRGPHKPGTIVIRTAERRLYYILAGGKAIQYGVGVGREGFAWSGEAHIARKATWPEWRPPQEMIERELAQYGRQLPEIMEGGPNNPLGARALYLFQGKKDTLYRIHGTNAPHTIGQAMSSGCIRMLNEEVIDLHDRVKIGTKVVVI